MDLCPVTLGVGIKVHPHKCVVIRNIISVSLRQHYLHQVYGYNLSLYPAPRVSMMSQS